MFKIPVETKPALWGAAAGAIALAIVGFSWGGWVTAKTAQEQASEQANAAVVAVLAPLCADKFRHNVNAEANLAELKKMDTWKHASFVKKGGWATFVGSEKDNDAIADACADLLGKQQKS
jgi:alpha/beta superfamily hydrolase